MSELVPVTFNKIMQAKSYTAFILEAESIRFAIYAAPNIGATIQTYVTERSKSRPFTHDLINAIIQGFNISVKQLVITDVEETVYFAKLYLEQAKGETVEILEIDVRPSDGFILALMKNIPLFCERRILEKVIPITQ